MRVLDGWWDLGTSQSRAIKEVRVVDMLDSGIADQLGMGRWHREVLLIDLLNEGILWVIYPMDRSIGC